MRGILALAARALRTDCRTTHLHWLRIALATALLAALVGVQRTGAAFGAPGLRLYLAIVEIDFWFVAILGSAVFAASIAEEREQRGLDLLRLAGLNALSILLGKSAGQLVTAVSLLAVQIPFALLAVTLGGVDRGQVLAGYAVLGGHLAFCFGVAVLMSTASRSVGRAAFRTALAVLFCSIWPLLAELVASLGGFTLDVDTLKLTTPYRALHATGATGFRGIPLAAPVSAALGLAAFVAAWLGYARFERRIETRAARPRRFLGMPAWGGSRRVPRWSASALYWKDYRVFVGGRSGLLRRLLAYAVVIGAILAIVQPSRGFGARGDAALALLAAGALGAVIDLGTLAARVFRDEARDGTYTSLLMLPKSVVQLARGKVGGCAIAALPAALPVAVALYFDPTLLIVVIGPAMLFFLVHVYLLLHLTVWMSLHVARGAFALTALAYLLVLGGGSLLVERFLSIGALVFLHMLFPIGALTRIPALRRRIIERLRVLS